ncbi:hypothetical protein ACIA8O_07150 [Kitasatospora sp. NPDC051853]|uniref:hypothetical protein n=1 Tax=Kitasatospora sp. NPDC051853 TaxID=3364058 RepID=UPI0037AE792E
MEAVERREVFAGLAGLLEARAADRARNGALVEAADRWRQGGALRRAAGDRGGEGEDLRRAAEALWLCGRGEEAGRAGRRAAGLLSGAAAAGAYLDLAEAAGAAQDPVAVAAWARRAVAADRRDGKDGTAATRARWHLALARVVAGGEGWKGVEEGCREAGDVAEVARAGLAVGEAALLHRDPARAGRVVGRTLAHCRTHGLGVELRLAEAQLTFLRLIEGHWREAARAADEALRRPGLPLPARVRALQVSATVRARCGEPGVWAPLDEAVAAADPVDLRLLGPVRVARAEAAWLGGDEERTAAEARHGLAMTGGRCDPWLSGALAVWVRRSGGRVPPVRAAGPFAAELAGDRAAAVAAWERLGCPYEAALAGLGGDAESVRRALAAFEAAGARAAAFRARARLRALGAEGPGNPPHTP